MVGTLVEVGRGKMTVDEFRKVIEDKDRCSAGSSVPGHALFLVEVGRGKMTVDEFRKVIEDKDRCSAGSSVPGHALFLVDVGYPEELFIVSPSDISNI